MLLVLCCGVAAAWNIGGDGLYVLQDFEDQSTFPETKPETEVAFNVEGQGEWLFMGSYQSTNSNYTYGGTGMNLRLPKNGSYVTTPVLTNGVSKVTFYLGRNAVKVYTSTDEGNTWTAVETSTSGKIVTATINSNDVNRIKIANESSKDSDIDNLAIYAQTFETPVTIQTGDATDITKTTATLHATIVKEEQAITEVGFVWSNTNKEPTLNDNVAKSASIVQNYDVQLAELAEGRTVYYRAYAKYGSTQTYGEVKSFKTLQDEVAQTIDEEGRYFVQDFEDQSTYPGTEGKDANTELTYNVLGGEWIYYNSYISTNENYNVNGSTANLRLPKNGTYVVTPVLNSGVKKVTWNQMRKTCVAYTSTDGGKTWTSATISTDASDDTQRIIEVNSLNVNRIKIANEGSGDASLDRKSVV